MDLNGNAPGHLNFDELYFAYAQEITDAPVIYHQMMAYMIVSSVIGKNLYLPHGYRKLYPNLYALLIGPSSVHRKSFSMKMGIDLIKAVHHDFRIQETSSRESFISEFAREDRFAPTGCGMLAVDELKGFMGRIRHGTHFEGFMQDLSSIYDNDSINRRKGVSKKEVEFFKIDEPFLNIVACCSFDWLSNSIEAADLAGGFFARFLWIIHNERILNPSPVIGNADLAKRQALIEKLLRIKEFIGEARWLEEARLIKNDWYRSFRTNNQGGAWDANYERLTAIVDKLALINAVIDAERTREVTEQIVISVENIKESIQFCLKTTTAFKEVTLGDSFEDRQFIRVGNMILKEQTIERARLTAKLGNISADSIDKIVRTLVSCEAITILQEKVTRSNGATHPRISYQATTILETILRR